MQLDNYYTIVSYYPIPHEKAENGTIYIVEVVDKFQQTSKLSFEKREDIDEFFDYSYLKLEVNGTK